MHGDTCCMVAIIFILIASLVAFIMGCWYISTSCEDINHNCFVPYIKGNVADTFYSSYNCYDTKCYIAYLEVFYGKDNKCYVELLKSFSLYNINETLSNYFPNDIVYLNDDIQNYRCDLFETSPERFKIGVVLTSIFGFITVFLGCITIIICSMNYVLSVRYEF